MPSPPKVRLFALCDAVFTDPATGKTTLVGIFDQLVAGAFPARHPGFVAYARLSGLNGRYGIEVQIGAPDLQSVVARGSIPDVQTSDPLEAWDMSVRFGGVEFAQPGWHPVRLLYNGVLADEFSLGVAERE
jgi:hypothetical protein